MRYLTVLVALGLLLLLHELGHLLAARLLGIQVHRFSLGFGPAVFSLRHRGTDYVLGAIPLGGFVRIHGMNPHEPGAATEPASFATQATWKRMLVLLAGPLANWLFALAVLFALYTTGTHVVVPLTVGTITPGSEAARAQLLPGDRILSVDGVTMKSWSDFVDTIATRSGQELRLVIERQGQPRPVSVRPRPDEQGIGRIGVSQQYVYRVHAPNEAFRQSLAHTRFLAGEVLGMVGSLLKGRQTQGLSPPVKLVQQSSDAAAGGLSAFLRVLVGLSVALALFHLLPLPSLDGARLLFVTIEAVSGRRVPPRVETLVHAAGFLALTAVVLAVTLAEVRQRFALLSTSVPPATAPPGAGAATGVDAGVPGPPGAPGGTGRTASEPPGAG